MCSGSSPDWPGQPGEGKGSRGECDSHGKEDREGARDEQERIGRQKRVDMCT